MKYFETELPNGYIAAKEVDAKNKKVAIVFSLISFAVLAVTLVVAWFALFSEYDESFDEILQTRVLLENPWSNLIHLAVFIVALIAYVILHELTHGLVYKILTKQKLTFGLTLSVAYCGVPNIYVYRKTALLSLLAPFIVFLPIFLVPMFFLQNYLDILLFAFMLGMHVGGCVGDLYDTALYALVFRDKSTLMRDTGPKQTFYVLQTSPLGQKILECNKTAADDISQTESSDNK